MSIIRSLAFLTLLAVPLAQRGMAGSGLDPRTPSAVSLTAAPGLGGDKVRAKELLKEIREAGKSPRRGPFEELAAMRNSDGFDALVKSLGQLRNKAAIGMLFGSIAQFADVEDLKEDALDFLVKHADSTRGVVVAAAVPRLKAFGQEGADALREVAESGRSGLSRALAIAGLRDELLAAPDAAALEIVLNGVHVPESGTLPKVQELLRAFVTEQAFKGMGSYVGDKKANAKRCQLILNALSGHSRGTDAAVDAGVIHVLSSAAKSKNVELQFIGLTLAGERGAALDATLVSRLAKSKDPSVRRAAFVAGQAGGEAPFDPRELATSKDPLARQAAAVGFGGQGAGAALDVLHALLGDEDPVVRLSAIGAVGQIRAKESIPFLIGLLRTETGRLRGDTRRALKGLTGRDLGLGPGSWERFWKAEGADFKVPTLEAIQQAEEEKSAKDAGGSATQFYGIEILSDRFALIVDTSGSMQEKAYAGGTRLDVAKKQLGTTLEGLKDGVLFNIISFDAVARPMKNRMTEAGKVTKKKSMQHVNDLRANGGTNIYGALRAAFDDDDVDTIYLMSDGDPSLGEITDVEALRAEVARWNSSRSVVIHCIAVGQPHKLLKGLAEDHNGRYVVVN